MIKHFRSKSCLLHKTWVAEQTVFDQTLNKASAHNAFHALLLKLCSVVTQICFLIDCFFPLGLVLFAEVAKGSNISSERKMWDENV